jgi:hypothetical protein
MVIQAYHNLGNKEKKRIHNEAQRKMRRKIIKSEKKDFFVFFSSKNRFFSSFSVPHCEFFSFQPQPPM